MKTRLTILVASVLTLLVVAATAARSSSEAWRGYQERYLELSRAKGRSDATSQPVEVKQDRLLGYGDVRIDRCRSCHVAVDDPAFAGGKEPLRTHPSIAPHAFGELGCSVCHEGDGRALTASLAHGEDPFWPEPLLRGKYIEASCAQCHPAPYVQQMEHVRRGRELFERFPCYGCHKVQGFSRGNLGVELTDIGTKRKIDFLLKKIAEPRFNQPYTFMPTLKMSVEEREDLAVFLKSLRGRPLAEDPVSERIRMRRFNTASPPELEVSVAAGRKAFESRGCLGCHKLGDRDGGLGPDLSHLGQMRDAAYVVDQLIDPRVHTPGSNMPNFWMSASERKAIALYLTSLGGLAKPPAPAEQYASLCARCHGEKGDGEGPNALNLLPRPRVFTNAKFFNWLPEERAHQAISNGVPGTAMPPFGKILDDKTAQALFAWIRVNFLREQRTEPAKPRQVPTANPVAYSAESWKRAKEVFAERCYGCHGRVGDGKGPNALEMLPRPRNLTNQHFFADLKDSRLYESITYGIVGTGMPPWADIVPEPQRWDLVNYVRHLSGTGPAVTERSK
jgi:mono/diheme cytochrome c family protein